MKIGLRAKFAMFFLVFITVITFSVYYLSIENFKESILSCYGENAASIAKTAATYITAKQIRYYTDLVKTYNQKPETDKEYEVLTEKLDQLKEASNVKNIYIARPINEKKLLCIYTAKLPKEENKTGYLGWVFNGYEQKKYQAAKEAMETGKTSKDLTTSSSFISAYVPILNKKENAIAYIGVDIGTENMQQDMKHYINRMMMVILIIVMICFFILLLVVQTTILNPIKLLKKNVEAMAEGKLGVQTELNGTDEIAGIATVFNRMSKNIEGHVSEIEQLNESYYKFVPLKIFELIGKSSVTDVHLGDQKNANVTVCTIHTKDFETAVHKIPIDCILNYITSILDILVPFVIAQGGVIEKFEDTGLTAFYTEESEKALLAAISACQKMDVAKIGNFYGVNKKIELAIGITYGPAMIGIVGHDKRLEATTISEQTTMASFLKKIAPKYNARILITASTAHQIVEFEKRYNSRLIGLLYSSSSKQYEKLYDVFDGDDEANKTLKKQTKEVFEKGVKLFCNKKFYEARLAFIEVLKQFRRDDAAREYVSLCEQYQKKEKTEELICYIEVY